jgi:hypothetical protein
MADDCLEFPSPADHAGHGTEAGVVCIVCTGTSKIFRDVVTNVPALGVCVCVCVCVCV